VTPYVPVLGGNPPSLLETAERRWAAIRGIKPDLAPALDLQRELLTLVIGLSGTLDRAPLPRLSLPPKYLAAKLSRGVPAFSAEPIPLPISAMTPVLLKLCDALSTGGAGDASSHIRDSISGGHLDAGSLLAASLARDQAVIRTGAAHRGLAADLVWLVGELAVSPFAHRLQQTLFEHATDEKLQAALREWDHGYCPACGSWPAVAEVVGGHRTLRCSFCSSGWERTRYACIYCNEVGAKFVTAAPNEERKDRRLEVCSNCGGYLKTVDLPELSPFPLLSISDIETTDLDLAAMEHGYARPPLKEFGPVKGHRA